MRYLCDKATNKVYAFEDLDFELAKAQYPKDIELDEQHAYLTAFIKISQCMQKQFYNYKSLDIMQECYYYLIARYRQKGVFAPDKPFVDNIKMWYCYAKKSCLFMLRQFKNITSDIDIWSLDDDETDADMQLGVCDTYIAESNSSVADIITQINKLCKSENFSDKQLGLYALCKLQKFSDKEACGILEIKMPRLYEIKQTLREYFKLRFINE